MDNSSPKLVPSSSFGLQSREVEGSALVYVQRDLALELDGGTSNNQVLAGEQHSVQAPREFVLKARVLRCSMTKLPPDHVTSWVSSGKGQCWLCSVQ